MEASAARGGIGSHCALGVVGAIHTDRGVNCLGELGGGERGREGRIQSGLLKEIDADCGVVGGGGG